MILQALLFSLMLLTAAVAAGLVLMLAIKLFTYAGDGGGLSLAEAAAEGIDGHEALMFLTGSVSSGMVGYLAIRFLLRFLANHTLRTSGCPLRACCLT